MLISKHWWRKSRKTKNKKGATPGIPNGDPGGLMAGTGLEPARQENITGATMAALLTVNNRTVIGGDHRERPAPEFRQGHRADQYQGVDCVHTEIS
jgi:hypothetical protein